MTGTGDIAVNRSTTTVASQIPAVWLIAYVAAVVAWVFLLPGYVADRADALTTERLETHLPEKAAQVKWDDYEARKKAGSGETIQPPFQVTGMTSDWLLGIWTISYFGFAILIVLWRSEPGYPVRPFPILLAALGLYVIFNWSGYIRAFKLNTLDTGRRVYFYAHLDVSRAGFVLQECRAFLLMLFIAFFIGLADSVAGRLEDSETSASESPISLGDLAKAAINNTKMLRLWQFSSLLLAVIFIPWSYFYWNNIVSLQDRRYLPSAIGMHLIWLFCWYQATRPLLLSLRNWREMKLTALSTPEADRAAIKDIAEVAHTESEWQLLTAGVTALGSLVFPLIKALR